MQVDLSTIKPEAAEPLALKLVDLGLAACVNIVPGITSVYRWEGRIQCDGEALLIIKTSDESLARLMLELPRLHPYEVPEIVALNPSSVHAPYAQWIDVESNRAKSR